MVSITMTMQQCKCQANRLWVDFRSALTRRSSFAALLGTSVLTLFLVASVLYSTSNVSRYRIFYNTGAKWQLPFFSSSSSSSSSSEASSLSSKHQVLLITYGRSGSTFTSALINFHKDVFFTFEPLYVLKMQSLYDNNDMNESMAIINAFLTCTFPKEYVYVLDNYQHRNSDATRDLYGCLVAKQKGTSHLSCFLQYVKACESHKISFVKTIRFRVEWAEWFLQNFPNFKLLYLMRDPRATLYSQFKVFKNFAWEKDIGNISKDHCSIMQDDIAAAERLKARYPDRVMAIRYENGALEPYAYTESIYQFLGLEYNLTVQNYIRDITNHSASDRRINDDYSVVRANSTQTMDKWRYSAGYNNVKKVDEHCSHLYPTLGYEAVESQKDLESQRPLVRSPDPGSIFS